MKISEIQGNSVISGEFQVFLLFDVIWVVPGTSKPSIFLQEYQRFQQGAAGNPPSRSKNDFYMHFTKMRKKVRFPRPKSLFPQNGCLLGGPGLQILYRGSLYREPLHRDPLYRESLYRGSLYRESLYRESLYRDSPYRGSLYRESLHKDSQTSQFLINFSLAGSISHQLPVILSHYE